MEIVSHALNAVKAGALRFADWIDANPIKIAVLWPLSLVLVWWFL